MERVRYWQPAVLLGLATIGAYGAAYYAIGVLIGPLADETGWSTGTLSAAFSIGVLGAGPVGLMAGRALDSAGARPVLLTALLLSAPLLMAASTVSVAWEFVALWGAGSAVAGGGLFYHATMTITARLYPRRRPAAFAVLTLVGALASPMFSPLAAALVSAFGWRVAIRLLVLLMVALVLPAAMLVRSERVTAEDRGASDESTASELRRPAVWRTMLAVFLAATGTTALTLHQVPAIRAAGFSLAAASGYAGARGLTQILGRFSLPPLVRLAGVRGALAIGYGGVAVATVILIAAGSIGPSVAVGVAFVAVAGASIGLLAPLEGLVAANVYGAERLGTLNGVQRMVASVGGAAGPWVVGLLVDASGGYTLPLLIVVATYLAAAAAIYWQRQAAV